METPVQTAARLLDALDGLIGREKTYLECGQFDLVDQIREKTAPIVRHLVELSTQPGVGAFRGRVAELVGRTARHSQIIELRMRELDEELRRADQARHRATQLVPAYVQGSVAAMPRFSAAG